jgi:diguanylate cyclase (GGDEF)-like protein
MKRHYKTFALVSLFLSIYIGLGYFYIFQTKETLRIQKFTEISIEMKHHLSTLIQEKREAVLLVALTLARDSDIRRTLLQKDISKLQLTHFSKTLKDNSSLKNVWFQLLDNKGISLYRSWTKKRGDNVLKSRLDIVKMIQNPKTSSLISTGKFNMTFKSIVPIYYKNKFIGIIETIAPFNSIVNKMQKKAYGTLTVVDKSYKKQLKSAITKNFIYDYYIATKSYDKTLEKLFREKYNTEFLHINNYIIDKNEKLLITSYHLKDVNGKEMGYFILSKKLSDINFSDIQKTVKNIVFTLFIIIFLIIGFSYYIYVIQYKKFIERQNKKLEEDVHLKTKELYYSAHHDALTNLPNRVLFTDKLEESLKFAACHDSDVFVVFLDLDRFKEVNDTYGHDVGDKLLKTVAKRLKKSLRDIDVIARLGGDEFTILIPNISYSEMIIVAKKIILSMEENFYVDTIKLHSSFSIGISHYPKDGSSVEELLKNADIAMYQAKADGKNRYKFYNQEMSDRAQERVVLENDIKNALENGEFEAYFQPKVNAKSKKIIGLEALIRWNHPKKGLVFPDKFINFAEEIGLIIEIDSYMRRETMRITKEWTQEGLDFGKVSFNASTLELEDDDFVEHIKSIINEMDYDTSKLELEILESQSIRNRERMVGILKEIRALGVSISIDDFGTGYSSLSYLKQLPVDKLKIDRSFILDVPNDSASVALVRTIITLANNLKLDLIAEGVESKEQVDFLVKEGCENIQGFYYSKPIPADKLKELLLHGFNT